MNKARPNSSSVHSSRTRDAGQFAAGAVKVLGRLSRWAASSSAGVGPQTLACSRMSWAGSGPICGLMVRRRWSTNSRRASSRRRRRCARGGSVTIGRESRSGGRPCVAPPAPGRGRQSRRPSCACWLTTSGLIRSLGVLSVSMMVLLEELDGVGPAANLERQGLEKTRRLGGGRQQG